MAELSLYGGRGFIGSAYHKKYGGVLIDRNDHVPKSDEVLYFISTVDNYNIFTDPHLDIDTNLNVLVSVLEECRKNKVKMFNFISSWFVYGDTELPAKETSVCNPKGFYSITKRTAEQLLISYCQTFDMNYRILRLGNVIGPGDDKVSAKKNALQYLINKLKKGEQIELYENGEFYRDYIFIQDCVDAINLVVTNGEENEIYNIGNGEPNKFKDIISLAQTNLGSESEIISIPQKEFHKIVQVRSMWMDNTKIKELGYVQKYDLNSMVGELCFT